MTSTRLSRRELLAGLGIASASTLLWACGRGAGTARPRRGATNTSSEVRGWLREAVGRLATEYPSVHALAVMRRRTTAALDVLGSGVGHARRDGLVFTVRDREGVWREQVTSDLSRAGVLAAVRALVGRTAKLAGVPVGPSPLALPPRALLDDRDLRDGVEAITQLDRPDSRIVYSAAMIDHDDATVWSITPAHDREQRLVRIRKRVLRAAWHGPRPVISEDERAWIGGLDDQELDAALVGATTLRALELMTPGSFGDQERAVILDPSVTASLIDAAVRTLFTSASARRPEVRARLTIGSVLASSLITLVDDPTVRGAYGGFVFDDEGELATAMTLIADGRVAAVLADRGAERAGGGHGRGRRPGHIGPVEPSPSHLRLAPGTLAHTALQDDGFVLEGGGRTSVDPGTWRVVLGAGRAREIRRGQPTGRVFGDVELVGDLTALLGAVSGVSSDSKVIAARDERDGEPRWRSIDAPWIRTRGLVRTRRRLG